MITFVQKVTVAPYYEMTVRDELQQLSKSRTDEPSMV